MNKLKCISAFVLLFSAVFFSCTTEPYGGVIPAPVDPNAVNPPSINTPVVTAANVVGNYILTAVNTAVTTNLNGDATASTNQMLETSCFNNNFFNIKADGTFIASDKGVEIENNATPAASIVCFSEPDFSGTWTLIGNTVKISYVNLGVTYNEDLVFNTNKLIAFTADADIVTKPANGIPVYVRGNVQNILTKL